MYTGRMKNYATEVKHDDGISMSIFRLNISGWVCMCVFMSQDIMWSSLSTACIKYFQRLRTIFFLVFQIEIESHFASLLRIYKFSANKENSFHFDFGCFFFLDILVGRLFTWHRKMRPKTKHKRAFDKIITIYVFRKMFAASMCLGSEGASCYIRISKDIPFCLARKWLKFKFDG